MIAVHATAMTERVGTRGISRRPWIAAYFGLNLLFLAAVAVCAAVGESTSVHILYLLCLFALCTSPLLWTSRLNDRFSILGLFFAAYFLYCGVGDISALVGGKPSSAAPGILSAAEFAILLGALLVIAGYHAALNLTGPRPGGVLRDCPKGVGIWAGLAMWTLGTYALLYWYLKIPRIPPTRPYGADWRTSERCIPRR